VECGERSWWQASRPFSSAWLDASWYHISTHQAPSVIACGATADEARDKVFNERKFYWDHVSSSYWWWRWYYAASWAEFTREFNRAIPKELLVAELKPVETDEQHITNIVERYGVASKFVEKYLQPIILPFIWEKAKLDWHLEVMVRMRFSLLHQIYPIESRSLE
jgi:hypothetical protein